MGIETTKPIVGHVHFPDGKLRIVKGYVVLDCQGNRGAVHWLSPGPSPPKSPAGNSGWRWFRWIKRGGRKE